MASCDQCRREVPQVFPVTVYDETQDYSAWAVVDELYAYLTGKVTLHVCRKCFISIAGSPPAGVEPPQNQFALRTLQSSIAIEIAKSLFQRFGYQVRHSGYEYALPDDWVSNLKAGDPNPAAASIRATPDLNVYDRKINNLYDVEVKTTTHTSSRWSYPKAQIDTTRHYHPGAILLVYVQPEHEFYAQIINRINWDELTTHTLNFQLWYQMNLQTSFVKPTELFERMTPDDYYQFMKRAKHILSDFR